MDLKKNDKKCNKFVSYQNTRKAGISSNIMKENVMYDKQSLVKRHVTRS